LSRPDRDKREVLTGSFDVLASVSADRAELITGGGTNHDISLLLARSMRHGLTLLRSWGNSHSAVTDRSTISICFAF